MASEIQWKYVASDNELLHYLMTIGIASSRALKAMDLAKESGNGMRIFYPEPTDRNSVSIRHDNGWYIKER